MGNDNETRYKLQLDAKDFIDQLNRIQDTLAKIDGIITQQGGKKFAIDVQIKNADFQRVFENLEKIMSRSEGSAEKLGESIERAFGKSKSLDRATKAINDYENAVRTSGQRVRDAASKTSEAISDVYKKQTTEVMTFINRADSNAKKFAQNASATYSSAVRQIKKDLQELGIDTSNMSAKDLIKFQQDLNKLYDRRQTSKNLTQNFKEGWEKTLNTVGEKMLASEERLADVRERNITTQTNLYRKEMEKIEDDLQRRRDADLEREEKRRVRMALYGQNVSEASRMLQQQIAESSSPEGARLTSQYNRAVQRIRGIYQAAVIHGRVENPETILAGLTELQQRSLALNNFRLSEQMGINELNEKLKTSVKYMEDLGTTWNKVSSVVQNSVQAFSSVQSFAYRITSTLTNFSRNVLTRISSQVQSLVTQSTEAFQSLEVSLIGFKNFFGEDQAERLYQRIKNIAAKAPGLATTDLADYVKQIAPVSGGNADLALNAALGMLKTIQYGGASGSSEMEYVIKNVRDVLAKGKATAIDVRQFNRAMPILEEVLESVGQSQLLKDGVLTIDKDNVDTILSAFAALNTSNQSAVAGIFSEMNLTLAGQWEQFTEQFTTNLMEALKGSQAYGGVQNLLSQVNNGEYVNTGLRKLQESLANFINGINWFKVQRVATEIWDGLKIIWEGVQDAAKNIVTAIGTTKSGNVITSFASWVADIIRGMSDGIAQVIKFVQNLEKSGVMDVLSRVIGWLGSSGAMLTKTLGTMVSHATNIAGNVMQLIARYQKFHINDKLKTLSEQLNAIPVEARSQIASSTDLLTGSGIAKTEVSAINNLTNIVNAHLAKIEANQVGGNSTLGKVETALNNGKRYFYSDDYDGQGNAGIAVWDKDTNSWKQMSGYASNQKETAYEDYQRLITQNRLQASSNSFLQKVGNNKYVDATLKWIKSAGAKILSFTQKLIGNLMQGGMTVMVTQAVSGIIESLDMFGDATVYVAGVVKSAGYAIAGALIGRSFGSGLAGGVVGALVGLGVGIAELVKTVKAKADELTNTQFQNALDDEHNNILNTVKEALINSGALEASLGKRSNEENYAVQQLSKIIANSSMAELLALGGEGLADVYGDAYRYKTIQENFTNTNEGKGFDWAQYATGTTVTKENKDYLEKIYNAVNKYDLLASHGYSQAIVDGQRVYVDSNGAPISAETIWDEFFNTQNGLDTVTSGQIDAMQTYLEQQEVETKNWWDGIETKLGDISTTPGETWYDVIKDGLLAANKHLINIANNTGGELSAENVQNLYGGQTGASATAWRSAAGYPTARDWIDRNYRIGTGLQTQLAGGTADTFGRGWEGMSAKNIFKWVHDFELKNLEIDALDSFSDDEAQRVFDYIKDNGLAGVEQTKILDKISNALPTTKDPEKYRQLTAAHEYLADFLMKDDLTNILWWFRWLMNAENSTGMKFFAHGGLLTAPAYRGVDTVPAMLAPGEFVMKQSAVKKAGLGMMYALNRGDLGAAARSLASNVNNNWYKNNNASINNSRNSKTNINNFRIINKNASARMNTYHSLANRLAF